MCSFLMYWAGLQKGDTKKQMMQLAAVMAKRINSGRAVQDAATGT